MRFGFNKKLLPLKAHYFLYNAGTAPIVPLMPVYVRQLGFSSTVVGTIYAILPVSGLLAKPIFGAVADRFKRQKFLFILFQLLTALTFLSIKFIPSIPQSSPVTVHCDNGIANFQKCPDSESYNDCLVEQTQSTESDSSVNCKFDCDIQPWMVNSSLTSDKNIEFNALVKLSSMKIYNGCLYFGFQNSKVDNDSLASLHCPQENMFNNSFVTKCEAVCDNPAITELIITSKIQNSEVTGLYQFWLLLLFLVLSWISMAVVVSVGDAICFEMLNNNHHLYGNQRLWGSIGGGIFSISAGFLIDIISKGQITKDYSIIFYNLLALMILDMSVSLKLDHIQTKLSQNILKDVSKIFSSLRIVIFFVWCVGVGLFTAIVWNFLFWHLETLASEQEGCGQMVSMKTLQGIAMGIQGLGGEFPFFFLSGWLLKKIGHINAMNLVLFGFGIRFLLYSILSNPWWVLPIEFLNGITFGIFHATMTSYASIVAPPGTEATLQGMVGAVFEGVGVAIGSLVGGILIDRIGGSITFRIYGFVAIVCCIIHFVIQKLMERKEELAAAKTSKPKKSCLMFNENQDDYRKSSAIT